jgi:hypothetical protein
MNASRGAAAVALGLAALAACSEANKQTYAQAAVGTVGAVAAVGVYRAVTHDCWAVCRPGYLCNRESGLCELGDCVPGCEYGWHCVREARSYRCVVNSAHGLITSSSSPAPQPVSSPSPFDAGLVTDAAVTDAAASPSTSTDAGAAQ